MTVLKMWDTAPGLNGEEPVLEYYPAENRKTNAAFVIFPGGAYVARAEHEGKGYAEFLNSIGVDAFVCEYRLLPNYVFPMALLDARRAVRYVRFHAAEYGLDPEKIAVMGSSAGGHLAAMVSTYRKPIVYESDDAVDALSPIPNASVFCYAVTGDAFDDNTNWFYRSLLGDPNASDEACLEVAPSLMVDDDTPPAFFWHTSDDGLVNVKHIYRYASALRDHGIPHEMHVFPSGHHGLGLAGDHPHVAQWSGLLANWLNDLGWMDHK